MGAVYLAEQQTPQRRVALKVIKAAWIRVTSSRDSRRSAKLWP